MPTLKELREKALLSVPELSKRSNVLRGVIYDIEAGKLMPKHRTVQRLATALKVQPEDITF